MTLLGISRQEVQGGWDFHMPQTLCREGSATSPHLRDKWHLGYMGPTQAQSLGVRETSERALQVQPDPFRLTDENTEAKNSDDH